MKRKCSSDKCAQQAPLRQTGFHSPHPIYFCPVCKTGYWEHEKVIRDAGGRTINKEYSLKDYPDDPKKWGAKKASYYFDKYDYWWRELENKAKHEAEEKAKRRKEEENSYW